MPEYIRVPVANVTVFRNLRRAAKSRNMEYEEFLSEILEREGAPFNDHIPPPPLSDARDGDDDAVLETHKRQTVDVHRTRTPLTDEQKQLIIYLHFGKQVPIHAIAERFGCADSTIQRQITIYKNAQHVQTVTVGTNTGRGPEMPFGKLGVVRGSYERQNSKKKSAEPESEGALCIKAGTS
jgi:transposase-like protein